MGLDGGVLLHCPVATVQTLSPSLHAKLTYCFRFGRKVNTSNFQRLTLLFAVQMKLTVEPTLTVCALGSSTVTSMGLDWTSGETQTEI